MCVDYINDREYRNFQEWIERISQEFYAFPSALFQEMLGDNCSGIHFLGKTENLQNDLIRALKQAGEKFNVKKIIATPEVHVAPAKWKERALFPRKILKEVINQNEKFMVYHGYSTNITDYNHLIY